MKTKKNYAKIVNQCLGVPIWNESVSDKMSLNKLSTKDIIRYHCEDLIDIKTKQATTRLMQYTSEIMQRAWED